MSQRVCSACSPRGWQQERAPEDGSRVRLRAGLQAPRPLDLCHTRTGCSVALGCLFFIGEGEAPPHHRLRGVMLSHSSSLLRPDPPVSPTPAAFPGSLVIPRVFARHPGLGCQRDLPCFGFVLLPCVPSPLRREEERGTPVSPRYPWPSSTEHGVGSSIFPHISSGEGFAYDAAVFASCYGPQSCWPSWAGPT
jgi:hypothetical protein